MTPEHFRQGGTETRIILIDAEREKDLEIHSLDATLDLGECWISSDFAANGEEDGQVVVVSVEIGEVL